MTRSEANREAARRGLPYVFWRRGSYHYVGLRNFSYTQRGSRQRNTVLAATTSGYDELVKEWLVEREKRIALGMEERER